MGCAQNPVNLILKLGLIQVLKSRFDFLMSLVMLLRLEIRVFEHAMILDHP